MKKIINNNKIIINKIMIIINRTMIIINKTMDMIKTRITNKKTKRTINNKMLITMMKIINTNNKRQCNRIINMFNKSHNMQNLK